MLRRWYGRLLLVVLVTLLMAWPQRAQAATPPYEAPAPGDTSQREANPEESATRAVSVPPPICQQVRTLRQQALTLVRLEPSAADALARALGYSAQASAGLMCVPLSVYVLQQAHLIPPTVRPADFWLLNPAQEPDKVQRLFPPGQFVHDLITDLPSRLDFRTRPFIPGDVLYFYSGSWGTFSHMMVVTYVDRAGRAYGLSNVNTPQGFVVREVLLYDPARPGVGQLARWNNPHWAWLGLTGFGGVEVWRPARWAPYATALGRGACAEPEAPGLWLWEEPWTVQATE